MKEILIVKTGTDQRGTVYDVYVNDAWAFTRTNPDNIFAWLQDYTEANSEVHITWKEEIKGKKLE